MSKFLIMVKDLMVIGVSEFIRELFFFFLGALYLAVYVIPYLLLVYFSDKGFEEDNMITIATTYLIAILCCHVGRRLVAPKLAKHLN